MTFRYIGSKTRLVDQIKDLIGPLNGGFFVDAFCGTGVVAEAAAEDGWPVRINDHLASAVISASARLIATNEARFAQLGGYEEVLRVLNAIRAKEGFIWRTYSPASRDICGIERRYFTSKNAGKIDAIRAQIREWSSHSLINETEERLLIADLFGALNRVANIAGTFGCFLAKWTPQAAESLELRPRKLKASKANAVLSVGDVFDVHVGPEDVVYLDPPYTKRQYASYYHILETVALGDEPQVEGVAGLRPWRDKASDFCYKSRALKTLSRLIEGLRSRRVLLSYSSEGHIAMDELQSELANIGRVSMHALGNVGRYRPNKVASSAGVEVTEYLVVVDRRSGKRVSQPLREVAIT